MTRETKIGLLTGLGVIILIGVLLSQYLGGPSSSHAANLSSLGDSYRQRQLNPVAVDPTVKPEGTMLAGVDNSAVAAPGTSAPTSGGIDPAISRLPTRDGTVSTPVTAAPNGMPAPYVSEPVSAQPVGPIVSGPNADSAAGSPVQLGPIASDNVERAIYVPVDSNNTQAASAGPAAPANPAGDVPTGTFYTVAKGDTLSIIAKHFYKSASKADRAKIIAANPALLKDEKSTLQIGKKLLIPDAPKPVAAAPSIPQMPAPIGPGTSDTLVLRPDTGTTTGPGMISPTTPTHPASPKPTTPTAAKPTIYTVQAGDNLAKIAKKFLGSSSNTAIKRIAAANRLDSPDDLEVGMKLKIPAKVAS